MRILLSSAGLVLALSAPCFAQDGQWSAADAHYDPAEMDAARRQLQHNGGGVRDLFLQADRLEYQSNDGAPLLVWDAQGWYGGDLNKLWIKSEGEHSLEDDDIEGFEVEALYSRAISPYFDLQAGVRQDFDPDFETTYGVLGVQGLAPYWFEVDGAAYLSEDGDVTAGFEAEYELLLTQRLILQPRAELSFSAQDVPELGLGAGLTSAEAGARLRYEIDRQFAPYIGVAWHEKFGDTADYARLEGEDTRSVSFVVGLRLWY